LASFPVYEGVIEHKNGITGRRHVRGWVSDSSKFGNSTGDEALPNNWQRLIYSRISLFVPRSAS
jgi:hypothetical protein